VAEVRIDDVQVTIEPAWWEQPFLAGRSRIEVPAGAVRGVEVVERAVTRGVRSGLVVTGLVKVGRWGIGTGQRQLVIVRRGVPVLRLLVDRSVTGYDEMLISTPDAARLAAVR
jgi:hypothetical protein